MTAEILSSSALAQRIQDNITHQVSTFPTQPVLKVLLIGDNPASLIYVKHKQKACHKVGIRCEIETHPLTISEKNLIQILQTHGNNPDIHGILVQFPLPPHIRPAEIIENIPPHKDVDGFHPYNLGRLASGTPFLRPCTPYGIIQLLEHYHIHLQGIDAIILGTSRIVGRPMALELLIKKSTVTICHTQTQNLQQKIMNNQLVIVATGTPDVIDANLLHSEHIVVDVGIHRTPHGKIRGDIDFDTAQTKVKAITPVPGGVGPMTIATLLQNLIQAYEHQRYLS